MVESTIPNLDRLSPEALTHVGVLKGTAASEPKMVGPKGGDFGRKLHFRMDMLIRGEVVTKKILFKTKNLNPEQPSVRTRINVGDRVVVTLTEPSAQLLGQDFQTYTLNASKVRVMQTKDRNGTR